MRAPALLAGVALPMLAIAAPVGAQESGDRAPPAPARAAEQGAATQVYQAADFARYSPKTAYDMLVRVPNFTIRSADQSRGLGQASENVLINGQRIANKSGGASDELQKIAAANVLRIEIADASTLGIAGLSGQVANVIVDAANKTSGQFEWNPEFRAHYTAPRLFQGNVSVSGKTGWLGYTLSVEDDANRGGYGGPIVLTNGLGQVIETRDQILAAANDTVTFQGKFAIDGPGTSEGNLTLGYTPYLDKYFSEEARLPVGGVAYARSTHQRLRGNYGDVSGDYAFGLAGGRLKLIGLHHFDHEPIDTRQIDTFADGRPDEGVRFVRDSDIGETVARAEYNWKDGRNDWQVALERAYNSLDQRGALFELAPSGQFAEVAFPEGSGHVVETRYEGIATWSRPLGAKADIQVVAGGEISRLARLDGNIAPRKFFRPKGSVVVGWRPDDKWDFSFRLRRRVGQISFYDFLAQPNLQEERESSGNPDLVPPQSWEFETEAGRKLGAFGQTRLRVYYHQIEDIIDIIPIGENGEAIGNLPSAQRYGFEWSGTIQFDPLGFKGARLDFGAEVERGRVRDPLTGRIRPIGGALRESWELDFRHDIPRSNWAWGASADHYHGTRNYFLTEVDDAWEGPFFASVFVENKDVFGLTVNLAVHNIGNGRHRLERDVFDGRRVRDPLLYHQSADQLIGPIFEMSVKGTF